MCRISDLRGSPELGLDGTGIGDPLGAPGSLGHHSLTPRVGKKKKNTLMEQAHETLKCGGSF